MRQLIPDVESFDPAVLAARDDRTAPPQRPWVMANMVNSVDGAYALDGRSGGLSSPGDRLIFRQLRAAADVVLVAAGTARAEQYGRPHIEGDLLAQRRAAGLADHPRLVVVSGSLRLPDDLPLLEGVGPQPLVTHPRSSDTSGVPFGVELAAVGSDELDVSDVLHMLRNDGVEVVLCEGGPVLLGQLHEADLVDELFVTVAPVLVGGDDVGLLGSAPGVRRAHRLHRLVEDDDNLFCTYRRVRD